MDPVQTFLTYKKQQLQAFFLSIYPLLFTFHKSLGEGLQCFELIFIVVAVKSDVNIFSFDLGQDRFRIVNIVLNRLLFLIKHLNAQWNGTTGHYWGHWGGEVGHYSVNNNNLMFQLSEALTMYNFRNYWKLLFSFSFVAL